MMNSLFSRVTGTHLRKRLKWVGLAYLVTYAVGIPLTGVLNWLKIGSADSPMRVDWNVYFFVMMVVMWWVKVSSQFRLSTQFGLTRQAIILQEIFLDAGAAMLATVVYYLGVIVPFRWDFGFVRIQADVFDLSSVVVPWLEPVLVFLFTWSILLAVSCFMISLNKLSPGQAMFFVLFDLYLVIWAAVAITKNLTVWFPQSALLQGSLLHWLQGNLLLSMGLLTVALVILLGLLMYRHQSKGMLSVK